MEQGAQTPPAAQPEGAAVVLAALAVLWGTTIILADGGRTTLDEAGVRIAADFQLRWIFTVSDLALAAAAVAGLAALPAAWRDRRRHWCGLATCALVASMVPAFVAHPADRGVAALFRLLGAAGVAILVPRLSAAGRALVKAAVVVTVAIEVVVAVAERARGGSLGLGSLGEPASYTIGGVFASTGLTVHPYVLAAFSVGVGSALLAAQARPAEAVAGPDRTRASIGAATVGVPFVLLGLTMSRAGLVGAVAAILAAAVCIAVRRPLWRPVASAAVGTAIGIALRSDGWIQRASSTTTSGGNPSSGRGALLRQGWGLLRSHPLLGTGPGRYVLALDARPDLVALATQQPSRPAHVVPFLLVVEGGLIGLLGVAATVVAAVAQTVRARLPGVVLAAGTAPFLLLDHLHWSYPQGTVLLGAWLGLLDLAAADRRGAGAREPDPAPALRPTPPA